MVQSVVPSASGSALRAAVLLLATLIAGCSIRPTSPSSPEYYLIGIPECKETDLRSDERIVICASRVEEILRQRYNLARQARTGGGVVQVITAATSSMLTGLGGANGVTAGSILAGISSIMPEVSEVVEAKGRAEAYADGMKSIGKGLSVYRKAIAESQDGNINNSRMTPPGARLYGTLRAAIGVVETRLAGLLPTTEELKESRSELEKSELVEVIPSALSLRPGSTDGATLSVIRGGPVKAFSANENVASVAETEAGVAFKVVPKTDCGKTTVTLINGSGGRESITVRVEPDSRFEVEVSSTPIIKGSKQKPFTVKHGCPIKDATSDNPKVARIVKPIMGGIVEVVGEESETARINLESESGRSTSVFIEVVKAE